MSFTPRQIQILFLLLNTSGPLNSGELAKELKISRRTVFRELSHVDRELVKYGVKLERKGHQGFEIQGHDQDRHSLMQALQSNDSFDPRNRERRHQELLKALFMASG